jgi:hypothetical protein
MNMHPNYFRGTGVPGLDPDMRGQQPGGPPNAGALVKIWAPSQISIGMARALYAQAGRNANQLESKLDQRAYAPVASAFAHFAVFIGKLARFEPRRLLDRPVTALFIEHLARFWMVAQEIGVKANVPLDIRPSQGILLQAQREPLGQPMDPISTTPAKPQTTAVTVVPTQDIEAPKKGMSGWTIALIVTGAVAAVGAAAAIAYFVGRKTGLKGIEEIAGSADTDDEDDDS